MVIINWNKIYSEKLRHVDTDKWIEGPKRVYPRKMKKRLFGTRRSRKRIVIFIRDNRRIKWSDLALAGL